MKLTTMPNTLTSEKAQQLTKDLMDVVSLDKSILEELCDTYIYYLNDKEVGELNEYIDSILGVD